VLFWIHGGGYEMGHGTDQAGDGAAFASSHGLVVVTFNYRLGALGFFDVPGERPAGALGLHDQIAALRWTHENIAGFGGDPCQITVYGLSAGGKTVTNLLASPLTRGLIARAAESSGGDHLKNPEQARDLAGRFLSALGTTSHRLRAVPARDILAAQLAIAEPPRSSWIWRPSGTCIPSAVASQHRSDGLGSAPPSTARSSSFSLSAPGRLRASSSLRSSRRASRTPKPGYSLLCHPVVQPGQDTPRPRSRKAYARSRLKITAATRVVGANRRYSPRRCPRRVAVVLRYQRDLPGLNQ
jgi:acetyl esterase/lipase